MEKIEIPEMLSKNEYIRLPPRERELYVREILRQTVKSNPHGVSVAQLSKVLPFDPRTIEKHLSILTYTNEAYTVNIGPTILYLPNTRAMHPVAEKALEINGREYAIYVLKNRFGKFVFLQERKKTEFVNEAHGGILIPLSHFKSFVDYLTKVEREVKAIGEKIE